MPAWLNVWRLARRLVGDTTAHGCTAPDRSVRVAVARVKRRTQGLERKILDFVQFPSDAKPVQVFGSAGQAKDAILQAVQDICEANDGMLSTDELTRGALVSGPSGNGRTLVCKALLQESGCIVLAIEAFSFKVWLCKRGHSENLICALWSCVKKLAAEKPVVLLIHGAEYLFTDCVDKYDYSAVFLREWDIACQEQRKVFVAVTTNWPDGIKSALHRRMGTHFDIARPAPEERQQLIDGLLQQHRVEMAGPAPLGMLPLSKDSEDRWAAHRVWVEAMVFGPLSRQGRALDSMDLPVTQDTAFVLELFSKVAHSFATEAALRTLLDQVMTPVARLAQLTAGYSCSEVKMVCSRAISERLRVSEEMHASMPGYESAHGRALCQPFAERCFLQAMLEVSTFAAEYRLKYLLPKGLEGPAGSRCASSTSGSG